MEHKSSFQLMIGNACIQEFDVMADIKRDRIGQWYIAGIYADALEIDGKISTKAFEWVRIPGDDPLHMPVMKHFHTNCSDDISDRWERHSWRYQPSRSLVSAGRGL